MTFGYLLNAYPMTSTTFIRREIEAHERAGIQVDRFAIRPWNVPLVDPLDIAEAKKVTYLLGQGLAPLLGRLGREALRNPKGLWRALRATVAMVGPAKGNRLKQFVYLLEAVRLKQEAVARGIDHLHTHFSTNSASVAMLSHLLGGPSYSITIHGPDELYEMSENSLALKTQHAAFVAVITEYCRGVVDDHTEGRFGDKLHIVRCGLDLRDFSTKRAVPETKDLVCVGRLCEAKDQGTLVDAFARVAGDHPEARLILIGDGDLRPVVEAKIAEHGLADQVTLAGWKENAEV